MEHKFDHCHEKNAFCQQHKCVSCKSFEVHRRMVRLIRRTRFFHPEEIK